MPEEKSVGQKLLDELHERAGYCAHCGAQKCAGKKQWSKLPDKLKTDDVLAAIKAATGETL